MGLPLETYEYNDNGAGLDQISSPTKGEENISTSSLNTEFDIDGSQRTRDGSSIYNVHNQIAGNLKSLASFDYRKSDGTIVQVLCNGTAIYTGGLAAPGTAAVTGLSASLVTPDMEFVVTNDDEFLLWGNGIDTNLKFNGTTWTNLAIARPTAPSFNAVGSGVIPVGTYDYYMTAVREVSGVIVQESEMSPVYSYTVTGSSDTGQATSGTVNDLTDVTKMIISSTATSGTGNSLTDTALYMPLNTFVGYYVNITGGTGAGQSKLIIGNTADTFSISGIFATPPDLTSVYNISVWGTNQWAGKTVYISSGTGSGQTATIASNTGTVLTFTAPVGIAPDATSQYTINTVSITLNVPTISDTQCTGRNLYRKNIATGVVYRLTATTTIGDRATTLTYTDNILDANLSLIEGEFDNQAPPKSAVFEEFNGKVYYRDEDSLTDFLESKANRPWNGPYTTRTILDAKITSMRRCFNVLVIGTERSIWTQDTSGNLRRVSSTIGILNNRSMDGETDLYFVGSNFALYKIEPTQLVQDNMVFGEPLSRLVGPAFSHIARGKGEEVSLKMYITSDVNKIVVSAPVGTSTSNYLYILNVKQSLAVGKPCWQIWDNINASSLQTFIINNEIELVSGDYNGFYWKLHDDTKSGDGAEMNGTSTGGNAANTLIDLDQIQDSGTATSGAFATLTDTSKLLDTGTASSGTNLSLTDITKTWVVNAYAGYHLNITAGTGINETAEILSNTVDTLVLATTITPPDITTVYDISSWRVNEWTLKQVYISAGTGSGQYKLVATNTSDTLTFTSPMVTAPAAGSVYSLGGWPISDFQGVNVVIVGGKGEGQRRLISSNTDSVLTLSTVWTEVPDDTSSYSIGGYTVRNFSNWKKVSTSYEVLKQLWYMWCNANASGDYTIKMILQFDFDTSLMNQITTLVSLKSENTIWGAFIWGAAIWGSRSVFLDRFRIYKKFRAMRVGFQHELAGQPFQINNYGASVQNKQLFWKNRLT